MPTFIMTIIKASQNLMSFTMFQNEVQAFVSSLKIYSLYVLTYLSALLRVLSHNAVLTRHLFEMTLKSGAAIEF